MGNATKVAHIRRYGETAMKWNSGYSWFELNNKRLFSGGYWK